MQMKDPKTMSHADLVEMASRLQGILFGTANGPDPSKEWDSGTFSEIGQLIDSFNLRPFDVREVAVAHINKAANQLAALSDLMRPVSPSMRLLFNEARAQLEAACAMLKEDE